MERDFELSSSTVGATKTTFDVLDELSKQNGSNITDIARTMEVSKSTVHNHLNTLRQLGYVTKEGRQYYLGLKLLHLSEAAKQKYPIYRVAKRELNELVEDIGERAQLMVEENGSGIYIYQVQTEHAVQTDTNIGIRIRFHTVATGKAYLAFQPLERREELLGPDPLESLTPNTITDREELEKEFAMIREKGFSVNDEERKLGMRAVGAPIISDEDDILGSISVSGPTTRLNGDWYREGIPELVLRAARVIGVKASFR